MFRSSLILCFVLPFFLRSAAALEEPKSVYSVDLGTDLAISAVALTASLVPYAFAGSFIRPRCPCLIPEINSFDRGGALNHSQTARTLSDAIVALAVVGPVAADVLALGINEVFWEDFIVFSQAIMISSALVSVAKVIVQRPLPLTYQGDPALVGSADGYRSFYSGHTTTAATALSAAAVTLSLRYDQKVWPWLAVTGATTSVALLRVLGGAHFISDTIVGAAMGTSVGILVPLLHRRERSTTHSFSLAPSRGGVAAFFVCRL